MISRRQRRFTSRAFGAQPRKKFLFASGRPTYNEAGGRTNTFVIGPAMSLQRRGMSLVELLAVVAIIAILVALLLPDVRVGHTPSFRTHCKNNMKQILLALHTYHDEYESFPPAYTVDAEGKPLHSWRTLILPYLEQQKLYDTIDLSKPWNHPANKQAFESSVPAYICPKATCPSNHTTYLAVAAPGGCFAPGAARRVSEITDGTAGTLLVVEVNSQHSVPWMQPADADEALVLSFRPQDELPHDGGTHGGFADGRGSSLRIRPPRIAAR